MDERVFLCLAHMSGNEIKYIMKAFTDNWVAPLGPNVNVFEADLKSFVESAPNAVMSISDSGETHWEKAEWAENSQKEVVMLYSGTGAMHLALIACGVGSGDEVICQSFTFCASCNPIRYLGAEPVFIDSEPDTWNMDPELLEKAIIDRIAVTGRKPKAIIPVYLYGMPAKIDEIMEISRRYGIPVVEDAAEGLGSRYKGRICGTFGEYGVLSFNGNKIITTSGGGALICPDLDAKRRIMFYATQARENCSYYQHEEIGFNYRMSNVCAGIGCGQMTILDKHIAHHHMLADIYRHGFADVEGITFHEAPSDDFDSNYWLSTITIDPTIHIKGQQKMNPEMLPGAIEWIYGVSTAEGTTDNGCEPNANVEALRIILDKEGIETRPLWKPMHMQPVYKDAVAYTNGVSEHLFKKGLCLPSGPLVTASHARRIVEIVKSSIEHR